MVDLGFFTMNLNGLEHNMLADDIWEMAGVPEYIWDVNRPRTLTMHKVGLTYNHTNQNINISRTIDNRNEDVSEDTTTNDDVRTRVSTILQATYDPNFDLQASGIPAKFTPPHSSTPIPNRYKMKKGNKNKPYPYRAPIKNVTMENNVMTAGGAALLGQTVHLNNGVPHLGPDMYTATKVVNMDQLSAADQDKTLEDYQE
jgi:hypothetical protein